MCMKSDIGLQSPKFYSHKNDLYAIKVLPIFNNHEWNGKTFHFYSMEHKNPLGTRQSQIPPYPHYNALLFRSHISHTYLLCCVWQFEPFISLDYCCSEFVPHSHQLVNESLELLGLRVFLIYQLLAYFYNTEYPWLMILDLCLQWLKNDDTWLHKMLPISGKYSNGLIWLSKKKPHFIWCVYAPS